MKKAVKIKTAMRTEADPLGKVAVPARAYWGAQTQRARENFAVSGIMPKDVFIRATAMVKKASCLTNLSLGLIDKKRGRAILRAADEIISGKLHDQFVVDVYQAGAGTSHNMNANEVIANRAIEILGGKRAEYARVHPNDHVNMSQSTNDTFPTAMRLAALESSAKLLDALKGLLRELNKKARAFDRVLKSGRTHLQDAVPVRLGQGFASYAAAIKSSIDRIVSARHGLMRIGLGATAAGTGMNTHPRYSHTVVRELRKVSGIRGLRPAPDTFEALSSMTDFSSFSSSLKDLAVELVRIANDLRLLSSGPRTGLGEIKLPPVQPGSSIMPGKVNPVMAEMLDMAAFQVIGNDLAVTMAAQAGQHELNVMGPVLNYNLLQSVEILTAAVTSFTGRCVAGITADKKRCREYFERSVGLATVLNVFIGYEKAAMVAKEAARSGRTIKEVVLEKGILTKKDWDRLMDPTLITEPADLKRSWKKP